MPTEAAYAAAEADVLPVEAHIIARLPSSNAFATAMTIPLSLKEPDGLQPSNLPYKVIPKRAPTLGNSIKGVEPSSKLTRGVL